MMQHQFLPPETFPASLPLVTSADTVPSEMDVARTQTDTAVFDALIQNIEKKARQRKRRFWGTFTVVESLLGLMLIAVLCMSPIFQEAFVSRHSTHPTQIFGIISMLLIGVLGAIIAFVAMLIGLFKPLDYDLSELTREGGVRAIPALMLSLGAGAPFRLQKAIGSELTILLPQLKASDANLLTTVNRRWLNAWLKNELTSQWLNVKPELNFILAILKAYEQVGDAQAVPTVERLAYGKPYSGRQRQVQKAALECLPLLQANSGAVSHTQTLLRAANNNIPVADTLLRPAAHVPSAAPDELLRPNSTAPETPRQANR